MRTNIFCANFLNTPRGPGNPSKKIQDIPDSSLSNPRKTNFRGRARTFRPPPLRVEDPTPPGGHQTQKVNLCAPFSCLFSRNCRTGPFKCNKFVNINFYRWPCKSPCLYNAPSLHAADRTEFRDNSGEEDNVQNGASLCIFARFCTFLRVSVRFFLP